MKHIIIEQKVFASGKHYFGYNVTNKRGEDIANIACGLKWCDGSEKFDVCYTIRKTGNLHSRAFSDLNEALAFIDRNASRFGYEF